MKNNQVIVNIINNSNNPLPSYETPGSAGLDLRAYLEEQLTLKPLQRVLIPTGLFIQLPEGFEAQIRPRSGLALNKGLTLVNTPGTIDSDYRGELKIIMINLSDSEQIIQSGDRIAQMVIAAYTSIQLNTVLNLDETIRGEGGFGSTGGVHHS